MRAYLLYSEDGKGVEYDDLTIGEPFYIFDAELENNGKIWYYPVYYKEKIFKLIAIYNYDDKLYSCITGEYVDGLNEVEYNSEMLIIKEYENTYVLDNNDNRYFLYEDNNQNVSEKNYIEWKKYIEDNYKINLSTDDSGVNESDIATFSGGPVVGISDGYECYIGSCFTKQYGYKICWAAAVATIVKFLKSGYENLTALDVAYYYGYMIDDIDTSTLEGREECLHGKNTSEVQMALALYDVAYISLERKLSYYEVRQQIKNGYPIWMGSTCCYYDKNGDLQRLGHATVIYGYYYYGSTQYMELWNPGNGETQQVTYYADGSVGYLYDKNMYSWKETLCNAGYLVK